MFVERIESPIGKIYIAFEEDFLLRISFDRIIGARGDSSLLKQLVDELNAYFKGKGVDFEWVPVNFKGLTDFEIKVLETLRSIPYGSLTTYSELAERVGARRSQRAVGNVLRKNPVPIIIPCHRVIRKNGKLGGYQSGIFRKAFLIDLERRSSVDSP